MNTDTKRHINSARLADVSMNTIVKVENGKNTNPKIETLRKIVILGLLRPA